MNVWTYACLVVGLLLVVAPVGALVPDTIAISTDPEWVTAGSGESATVTVRVNNSTSGNTSFEGVAIDFEVDGEYGSISPARVGIDSAGRSAAVFKPGTRSGTATITATVSCGGLDEPLTGSVDLYIDHAAPYGVADILYTPRVTAGGTTDITVLMVDRYGNLVDSKREDFLNITPETVSFTVGSPGGGATFVGGTDEITVPVDDTGNATVTLEVSTLAGENIVYIQPPKPIRGQYITVRGVADGVPAGITCTVNPSSASVPANGKDTMTLMYTLTDEYGNPAGGQGLWVNASVERVDNPDEHQSSLIYSSSRGEVWVKYGPEESVGVVTITATAAANASVTSTTQVEFTSTEPVKMVFSASPQSMPSGDVPGSVPAILRAKVMDIKGNPVDGEVVTFQIVSNSSAPYKQTEPPALNKTSAVTINGSAVVGFTPGSFARKGETGWNKTATGTATVRATWENVTRGCYVTRDINLTWKNYPYISVETEVSNETVAVNETVDVTIRLKGDGYAMRPDPIDVVLVIDRSGSMKWDIEQDSGRSNERMNAAKAAASTFIDQMDPDRDRVGLVSFSSDARLDASLTNDKATLESKIDGLTPTGATNMREAFYKAISHLDNNGRPEAVKAVILMSDGDWNYHGTPLAHGIGLQDWTWSGNTITYGYYEYYDGLGGTLNDGWIRVPKVKDYWGGDGSYYYVNEHTKYYADGEFTNQNMSNYAISGNISLYTITFAYNPDSEIRSAMETLASSTNGFYEHAPSGEQLNDIYKRIAGELKTNASVDTEMNVVFENVMVNKTFESGADVFDYIHEDGISTTIESWIDNGTEKQPVIDRHTRDDTLNWTSTNPHLPFDIGTMRLNQTWETKFRLKVLADGNINIFGPGSNITFNNGNETLTLPDTFITAVPDLTNTGLTSSSLAVRFTEPGSGSGPYTDLVPLKWTTAYKGTEEVDISLAYSRYEDMRSPTTFFTKTLPPGSFVTADNTTTDSTMMPVKDLSPGQYWITVTASARDAETDEDTINVWAHTKGAPRAYIKIG